MCSIRTFVPLLQAAVSSECTASYIRIFKEATSLWNSKAAPSCQLPGNLVQLHRDFHAGSEAARKAVFPTARPMDDYAHLVRNLQKHLARTAFKGRASDPTGDKSASLCSRVLRVLHTLRCVPTVELCSELSIAFLAHCRNIWKAPMVADYLESTYTTLTHVGAICEQCGVEARGPEAWPIAFCSWWAGVCGCAAGSASGTQALEAFHSPWERQLRKMGKPATIDVA